MHRIPATIVVAPDSFKESLHAAEVAAAIVAGFRELWPATGYVTIPMADGGDGTVAAVVAAAGGSLHTAPVTGPLGEPVAADFGILPDGTTAILELAAASGLELVPPHARDPMRATSYGVGELLLSALDAGVHRCVLGIGGSATIDGGAGMLQALGAKLLTASGQPIARGGAGLATLASLDLGGLDPRLARSRIEVACDVDNTLLGPQGAAAAFGIQKGATPKGIAALEDGLCRLARIMDAELGTDVANIRGGGAAGGVGAALSACLGAPLRPGAALIAELVGLEAALRGADLVITGEGRIDAQTVRGKVPVGVAAIAKRYGKPVIAFAGSLGAGWEHVLAHGIDAVFPIAPGPCTREEAFARTAANLSRTARNVAAVWLAAGALAAAGRQGVVSADRP